MRTPLRTLPPFLLVGLLAAGPAAAADAEPKPNVSWAISAEMQSVVASMLDVAKEEDSDGWRFKKARIDKGVVAATFAKGGKAATANLSHPQTAEGAHEVIGPFSLTAPKGALPDALKNALRRRILAEQDKFKWVEVTAKPVEGAEGPKTPPPPADDATAPAAAPPKPTGEAPPGVTAPGDPAVAGYALPESGKALLERVNALIKAVHKGDEWRTELDAIRKIEGAHPEVLYRLASGLDGVAGRAVAGPIFEETLTALAALEKKAKAPPTPMLLQVRGGARLALGKTAEGLADLALVKKVGEAGLIWDRWSSCDLSHALRRGMGIGDAKAYHAFLDEILGEHDACALAMDLKVEDLMERDMKEEALAILVKAAEVDKPAPVVLERLAGLYRGTGEPRKAVEVYRRLCRMGPCTARVRGNLVWAHSEYHLEDGVAEAAAKAAEAAPDDPLLQFEAGVMWHYNQDYDLSDKFLGRAKKTWPRDPRILLYMAMNAYRSGRQAEAEEAITAAVRDADAEDADLFYCTSVIFRNKDLPRSIENLERYRAALQRAGKSPPQKLQRVERLLVVLKEEATRRAQGQPPRPIADPEADFFGEPPGSPGRDENAIHIVEEEKRNVGPGANRKRAQEAAATATTGDGEGSGGAAGSAAAAGAGTPAPEGGDRSNESPGVGSLPIKLAVGLLVLIALFSVLLARRGRKS